MAVNRLPRSGFKKIHESEKKTTFSEFRGVMLANFFLSSIYKGGAYKAISFGAYLIAYY